eukprot:11423996-Karenia_brevis.AAC.1
MIAIARQNRNHFAPLSENVNFQPVELVTDQMQMLMTWTLINRAGSGNEEVASEAMSEDQSS